MSNKNESFSEKLEGKKCFLAVKLSCSQIFRAFFLKVSKIIQQMLWLCIVTFFDGLNYPVQLSQPIRCKAKTEL